MKVKSPDSQKAWVDRGDAPELTEEFFEKGEWRVGDKVVSRNEVRAELAKHSGRPAGSGTMVSTTIRFDAGVLEAFKLPALAG